MRLPLPTPFGKIANAALASRRKTVLKVTPQLVVQCPLSRAEALFLDVSMGFCRVLGRLVIHLLVSLFMTVVVVVVTQDTLFPNQTIKVYTSSSWPCYGNPPHHRFTLY